MTEFTKEEQRYFDGEAEKVIMESRGRGTWGQWNSLVATYNKYLQENPPPQEVDLSKEKLLREEIPRIIIMIRAVDDETNEVVMESKVLGTWDQWNMLMESNNTYFQENRASQEIDTSNGASVHSRPIITIRATDPSK